MKRAQFDGTFESWRQEARSFLQEGLHPSDIYWSQDTMSLFEASETSKASRASEPKVPKVSIRVPKDYLDIAEAVSCARTEDKWDLLYRILYRLHFESNRLLEVSTDPDVHRAELLRKSVRRDIHKMHAFVRFKESSIEVESNQELVYVAWHRPEHLITRLAAPFFVRRFGDRKWSIFTPDESVHWNLHDLVFDQGIEQNEFQARDDWDDLWKTYYKSIFNPARIKMKAMKMEMAPKYWASLPEASLIPELVREAPKRLQSMVEGKNSSARVDTSLPLESLKEAAKSCRACPLYSAATQTVFGEGPSSADIMIIGEQPGDQEDIAGRPFVGPAGQVLDEALREADILRDEVYLTNAVKHFKWTPQGKTRLHQKPRGSEIHACKPWLEIEIARVKPKVIVALGTTAALAVLGKLPKLTQERGRIIEGLSIAPMVILSWHPAAILRSFDENESLERKRQLAQDLALAHEASKAAKEKGSVFESRALPSDRPPL